MTTVHFFYNKNSFNLFTENYIKHVQRICFISELLTDNERVFGSSPENRAIQLVVCVY